MTRRRKESMQVPVSRGAMLKTMTMLVVLMFGLSEVSQAQVRPTRPDTTLERERVVFERTVKGADGRAQTITLVEVVYAPGGGSAPHRHPCGVVGYVVSGSLRFQVKGSPERVYPAGATFYEGPQDVHLVSANASSREPATLLAYFSCMPGTPLSVGAPPPR